MLHLKALQKTAFDHSLIKKKLLALRAATTEERKSGYVVLKKVSKKTSQLVRSAIIKCLKPISDKVKTITFDNGREFSDHAKIDEALDSVSYFAYRFSSWQRVLNENINGLVRQYIPKNRPLSTVTHDKPATIQDRLNNRSKKL